MLKLLNFKIIIEQASGRYNALSETKQKELKESLSNGKALLKSSEQLDAYLYHYSDMHRKKLLRAYSHIPESIFRQPFSVIDWGCGQGIASMVLDEFLVKQKFDTGMITDVTLIEPSKLCLRRAAGYLEWSLPNALLTTINRKEEGVEPEDLCVQENTVMHILSNVVDMPEFSGDGIRRFLNSSGRLRHIIIMASPFYPEDGRGKRMDDFSDSLNGFHSIYSFQRHIDEWDEDFSCQIRILDNISNDSSIHR